MKPPGWWPVQTKKRIIEEIDIPPIYFKLLRLTNVYDPYKKKAYFLFVLGMAVIAMLDIPGLFFTNPFTHQTSPEAFYLGILGAIVVGLMGLASMWAYQYHKNNETAPYVGGAFNLRVRKKLRVGFHAILGTIERIDENLTAEIKAVLDNKVEELRQLAKIRQLDTSKVEHDPGKLNWFYIPLPNCPAPEILLGSPAIEPEQLTNPMPGEYIWDGWIRQGKTELFDLAVVGEYSFKYPGLDEIQTVPICVAAGTYYDYVFNLERALLPPKLDSTEIDKAKALVDARVIGVEAVQQLQIYKQAVAAHEQTRPVLMELATDVAGNILDLITLRNKPGNTQPERRGHMGAIIGGTAIIAGLALGLWVLLHGGRLF